MDLKECKAAVEAVLFAHGEPVTAQRIADALEMPVSDIERMLIAIKDELLEPDRGLTLLQLDDRYQLASKSKYGDYIKIALDTRRNVPLSPAGLEVLAIIAYNQPVSRSFVEQVRGVDSSSSVRNLMEKGLVEEAGRLDLPGKPVSFKTTDVFLRTFGISSLADLPPLHSDDYTELQTFADEPTQSDDIIATSEQVEMMENQINLDSLDNV